MENHDSISLHPLMNLYEITIVNYSLILRIAAASFPSAYNKALQVISCWEGSEQYEVVDIKLIGPMIC